MRLAILADDLTGALDAAAPFAHHTNRVEVWLGPPRRWMRSRWAHVVAVTTETRNTAPALAAARVTECAAALQEQRPARVYKKIDSTLRGPWVEELEAVRAVLGERAVALCPAFPEQGRVVRSGVVYERGSRIGDCVAMLCERMTPRRGRILQLPAASGEELAAPFREGAKEDSILVCDAETPADLRAIAVCAAAADTLLCGSAGLARALSHIDGRWPGLMHTRGRKTPIRRAAVVIGSAHAAARRQLRALCAANLPVDILATPDPDPDAPADPLRAGILARELSARHSVVRFNALVLTGGETAAAVLGVLKATRLELVEELEPGIPVSRILDGHAPGALCITKAGGFGDDHVLVRMVQHLGVEGADDEG